MAVCVRALCGVLLLLAALSSVTAVQKLNTIKQLKKVDFGASVPKHGLLLLHWFANTVDINNNDVIFLTFELGDYGSHHYGNFEELLNVLPPGNARRYYTVGNLYQNRNDLSEFPYYVTNPPSNEFRGTGNQDRIIFRVRECNTRRQNQQIVDEVYLTQHYGRQHASTSYDPLYTYQITTHLLREIRQFSVDHDQTSTLSELRDYFQDDINDHELRSINAKWSDLAILGLLLYIVIDKKHSVKNNQPKKKKQQQPQPQRDYVVNIPDSTPYYYDHYIPASSHQHLVEGTIELKVTTRENGKARITWKHVPHHRLKEDVMVALYRKGETDHCFKKSIGEKDGSCDTSEPLNEGLQARLHKTRTVYCFWKEPGDEITRGPEFTSPGMVGITGYDAYLQLFVKDGKACARIFIERHFREWTSLFQKAWVGFYTSADKNTDEYAFWKWQWVTKFTRIGVQNNYTVLEYHSGMTIAQGVQARFINEELVKACSQCWQ